MFSISNSTRDFLFKFVHITVIMDIETFKFYLQYTGRLIFLGCKIYLMHLI